MNINWKVRLKNKTFWVALIPAGALLVQQIAALAGVSLDLSTETQGAVEIVNTVFTLLAILGVVVDPTTTGTGDSEQAMTYTEPKKKG